MLHAKNANKCGLALSQAPNTDEFAPPRVGAWQWRDVLISLVFGHRRRPLRALEVLGPQAPAAGFGASASA
eukprot:10906192-Alexandrium_andersonii.AAC.1